MVEFKAAFINEVQKLYKKKKVLVAVVLSIVLIIIGQIMVLGIRNGFGLRGVSSMDFPILVLSLVSSTIIPLFTALVAIDSFSGEFSHNTMKITLTRPVTRLKVFASKLAAIMVFVAANLLFVMIFSMIAGVFFNSNSFSLHGVGRIIISYFVTIFPMLILAMFIILLANIFKGGVSTFFASIFIFIIFKVLEIVFSRYSGIFFTSFMNWYALWIMDTFPLMKITRSFMMLLSYGILLFTGGYYLFDKKEF